MTEPEIEIKKNKNAFKKKGLKSSNFDSIFGQKWTHFIRIFPISLFE